MLNGRWKMEDEAIKEVIISMKRITVTIYSCFRQTTETENI